MFLYSHLSKDYQPVSAQNEEREKASILYVVSVDVNYMDSAYIQHDFHNVKTCFNGYRRRDWGSQGLPSEMVKASSCHSRDKCAVQISTLGTSGQRKEVDYFDTYL